LVRLVRDNRQPVDALVMYPLAVLVDWQPEATTNLLALAVDRLRLFERANLEDAWIVPAFAQRRVGEDEPQGIAKGEQLLLVLHDPVVGRFIVSRFARRVLDPALFVDREIAIM